MSNQRGCRCLNQPSENWVVVHYHRSRISTRNENGIWVFKKTTSSTVRCTVCKIWWRTDARYVERLTREDS
jgi:hypothetical protein